MPSSEELQMAFNLEWEESDDIEITSTKLMELDKRFDLAETRARETKQRYDWDVLAKDIHPVNVKKGFWGPPEMMDKWAAKLALIHSEVTEVLEALRKSQGSDKVTEEFADIFIRALDLYGDLVEHGEADPQLYGVLLDKLKVNAARPPKHGNRWG